MVPDRVFGNLIDLEQRLGRHQADLAGVKHRHRLEPLDPVPGQPLRVVLTTSGPQPFEAARGWYVSEPPGAGPGIPADPVAFELFAQDAAWDTLAWGYVRRWVGVLPPQPAGTMVRYRLAAQRVGTAGEWVFADNQAATPEAATEFAIWIDAGGVPAWTHSAMVYQIFMDRFNPGQGREWLKPDNLAGFFGGTLRGVIEKLDYIRDLGFNTLWLSPLFASPSHHGYDAIDYYTVEPRLGTHAELLELIASAHTRGLRVLFDFVANHWSHRHASFQAALADRNSEFHDWYTWNAWPDDYETYFGVRELPQLNLRPGPARDHLLAAAQYWLRLGVDGFRLDYAYGPSHDFWSDFYRACRTVRPDCWLFGEIIHTAEVQRSYAGRLDGTLDFLLSRALRETFAHGTWDLAQFEAFLAGHEAYFPPSAAFSRPAFIDNHDMNRILFAAGEDHARVRLAALVLFTLSGPPIVYYGTEVGVSQERPIHQNDFGIFEEARLPMQWDPGDPGQALRGHFRRLAHLRQAHPVLQAGTRRAVHVDAAAGAYAFLRESELGRVLVAINLGAAPAHLRLAVPGFAPAAQDQLSGSLVRVSANTVELDLPARTGAFVA